MRVTRVVPAVIALGLLASCASYSKLPLPETADLPTSLAGLHHDGVDVQAPLSVSSVATLAVINSPDLLATRAQHGVAQAQVISAGILPNPQIYGFAIPAMTGPGTTAAYNVGITGDVKSLVTLSLHKRAARDAAAQVDAQILWQEWQTIGQARLLAVDLVEGAAAQHLLDQARDMLGERSAHAQRALAEGNTTLATTLPDLAALQAARAAADDMQRQQLARRHQLNALLGLAPEAVIPLDDRLDIPPIDDGAATAALADLGVRRPDLAALRLGYAAQDASLRADILAQFPTISIGFIGGSDNSNTRGIGPQIYIDLPIFDRGQGKIGLGRATRQQLHDEYTARLAAATGQVRAMLREQAQLASQHDRLRNELADTNRAAHAATAALANHDIDERGYLDLVMTVSAKELEILTIEKSMLDQQVALATLIGAELPSITLPTDKVER